jgi:hypothetical protein
MDKQLGKELRKQFEEMIKMRFPQFLRNKKNENSIGCRIYQYSLLERGYAFIMLQPFQRYNCFSVELAASLANKYPDESMNFLTTPYNDDSLRSALVIGKGNLRCHLGDLEHRSGTFTQGEWNVSAQKRINNMYSRDINEFESLIDFDLLNMQTPNINEEDKNLIKTSIEDVSKKLNIYAMPFFSNIQKIMCIQSL